MECRKPINTMQNYQEDTDSTLSLNDSFVNHPANMIANYILNKRSYMCNMVIMGNAGKLLR